MRVLMICRQFLPVANGAERQAAALARELNGMGHRVTVVAARFNPEWPERETIDGFEVVRLPSPRIRYFGTWRYLRALHGFLRAEAPNFDVVHVHFAKHSAACAANLSQEIGKPVICKPVTAGEFGDLAALRRTPSPKKLLSGLMNLDRIVALSEEIASEWIDAGFPEERVAIIPNGVNANQFCPADESAREQSRRELGLPVDGRLLLGVGRLERQKGFDILTQALATAPPDSNLHVALAGEGSLKGELRALAESKGVGGRLHLLGRIDPIEKAYRAADLFVLPSRGEGMSNALLEAMACGLDVAATKVSGVAGLVSDGENGLLAEAGSAEAFARAIERWFEMAPGTLGRRARQTIEQGYTLRVVAERYLQLYDEVIEERGGKSA